MAYLIQKPDEIATGLVLMGSQGTGKGKFAKTVGRLLGKHFLHLDNLDRLLGNFNFHMKNAVLVFGDEAIWGGNKKDIGKLKAMVTEEYAMIEPKGKDAIAVRNFRHFILSSNVEWPVHLDPDDRRFLVLQVSETHKEDFPYFRAIDDELDNGGLEALLYELLNEDISDFNPRELPTNNEAFDVKLLGASTSDKYLYSALSEGSFDIGNTQPTTGWPVDPVPVASVYADFEAWCHRQNLRVEDRRIFGKSIARILPSVTKTKPRSESRKECYEFPDQERARKDFEKAYKTGGEIWE